LTTDDGWRDLTLYEERNFAVSGGRNAYGFSIFPSNKSDTELSIASRW
jgi:hypothetical protein